MFGLPGSVTTDTAGKCPEVSLELPVSFALTDVEMPC